MLSIVQDRVNILYKEKLIEPVGGKGERKWKENKEKEERREELKTSREKER